MNSKRILLAALLALSLGLPPRLGFPQSAAPKPPDDCRVPEELIQDDPRLPLTAARLKSDQPLTIVVIGGSSTVGEAAGSAAAAYPHQLEEALHRLYPKASIAVINKGEKRQTAKQMIDRFARDVLPAKPALVIWEVGIIDAVNGTDLDAFAAALQDGLAELRQKDIEVMLIDMQYSPATASVINFGPYLDTLRQTADLTDTYVFRRYDVMEYWSDTGVFQLTDVPRNRSPKLAARIYECVGERLAEAIAYATQ